MKLIEVKEINIQALRSIAHLIVAFNDENNPVAFMGIEDRKLEMLFVSPGYRGKKGIGKEMFSQSCQIAKINGCSQIEVACNQLRENTHHFYMREGMNNFHSKFSKRLCEYSAQQNSIGI